MCRKVFLLTSLILVLALVSDASAALVSHYRFDETSGTYVNDSVGGYDGQLRDSAQFAPGMGVPWIAGSVGSLRLGAGYTHGQSNPGYTWTDRAEVPFGITASAGSIALWATLSEDHYWNYFFGIKDEVAGTDGLQLTHGNRHAGGTGTAYVGAGLGDDWDHVPSVYPSEQLARYTWHHLVLTWEATGNGNGDFHIYLCTSGDTFAHLVTSGTYSGLTNLTGLLDIGADGDQDHQKGIMGYIDDVHVFNHALTLSEINWYPNLYVPEPATIALLGLGGLALLHKRR